VRVVDFFEQGLAGQVRHDHLDRPLLARRSNLAVHPIPAVRLAWRLGRKLAAGHGRHGRLLQRDRERPAREDIQPLGLAGKHVQEHAQVNGLAHSARADRRNHLRINLLAVRLVRKRQRREAMPAELRVEGVALVTDIARQLLHVLSKPIRIEIYSNMFVHWLASTSSGCAFNSSAGRSCSRCCVATSHKLRAQRKPILCLRNSGRSPLWNWQLD
jgi:hypothetical protein